MKPSETLRISTPSECEVVVRRRFAAPCASVFRAFTEPELLRRWYCGSDWTFEVCEIDLRVGGHWRYVMRRPSGKRVGQHGVFREIVVPTRVVNTESWEDWDPGECLVTNEFSASPSGTEFTSTIRFPSQEVRDVVLHGGLEASTSTSYSKLDELLAERSEED
jgi:uncharacterized protein YndB with AHSA1/START domain